MKQAYRTIKLRNNLKVVMHRMPQRQSLSLGFWIKVGGRYENKVNKGSAHFLEHILFKGTDKYSCRKLKESIEGIGGSFNAFTSEEFTCYLVKVPQGYLRRSFDILSDMVLNPTLPSQEIEKERSVILEELKMYKDLPQSYCFELLDELLWPNQPLGAPIIGSVESVSGIDRKALSFFKEKHYTASNMVISIAGDFDDRKFEINVERCFSGFSLSRDNAFDKAVDAKKSPSLNIFYKDTEQTHMALGFASFKRGHPLRHALGLLHVVLGGNMSSRLFNEIREKRGLAYEIGTAVKRFNDTGAFLVHAGIDNTKVLRSVLFTQKELLRVKDALISEAEFKRAKEFYIGQLRLSLEDTMEHMLWIGESTAALNKVFSLEDIISEVSRVQRKDILRAAREIFSNNNFHLSLIGPVKGLEEEIRKTLSLD